ncbi:MAG: glycosyltransferase family 39 protein, partial [Proteobacteria bacterium]|nr:glycosyltransferase family 39 protein [Pseudomonadota bacterium]
QQLYTYLLDHHPPGTYVLFMLTELIFGYSAPGIIYMGTFFSLVTMLFIFLFIRVVANTKTALAGALFWALASNSISLEANLPNTELYMNAFTMIALWAFVRFGTENRRGLALTGLCFAIASIFKMVAIFPLLAVALYLIIEEFKKGGEKRFASSIRKLTDLAIPGFILWTLVFFYFIILGRFSDFWEAVFIFNRAYSESVTQNIFYYFTTAKELFHHSQIEIAALALFSILFLILSAFRRSAYGPVRWPFFILLLLGTMVEVASPGYFFAHYYQLFVPLFSIMAALLLFELYNTLKERAVSGALTLVIIAGLIPALTLGFYQAKFLKMSVTEISQKKYTPIFMESYELAKYIKERTEPCETIYLYGQDTGVYYYSQRRAATGIIFVTILFFGSKEKQRERQKDFYGRITGEPPAFFIWDRRYGKVKESIFYNMLKTKYDFTDERSGRYLIYELKNRAGCKGSLKNST